MIRFARPVATLALTLALVVACGGSPAAATPTSEPDETEDVSTLEPEPTPEVTATSPAGPTASTETLDEGTDWPTTVNVTLDPGIYVDEYADGSFTSVAPARNCGSTFLAPGGFVFGFPHDLVDHDVHDISFSALELVPGTSTESFFIRVDIETPAGAPPGTHIDTDDPRFDQTGTAQLSVAADGTRTLAVDAVGEGGVEIHLAAVCSPI